MLRLRTLAKTTLELPDLPAAERFFRDLGLEVTGREPQALLFSSGLCVRQGYAEPGSLDLVSDADLDELAQQLVKSGHPVEREPQFLEVELAYDVFCRIYPQP